MTLAREQGRVTKEDARSRERKEGLAIGQRAGRDPIGMQSESEEFRQVDPQ